jgi:hypothetical protein
MSNANKVVFGDKTLLDLTNDTVSSDTLGFGITAHDKSGRIITGNLVPLLNQPQFLATNSGKIIKFSNTAFIQVKGDQL